MATHLPTSTDFELELSTGVTLAGEDAGAGEPILLLHGLSATRRNVVQGSSHLLRRGCRLIGYDARGHGASSAAPERGAYEYADLLADLEQVLERLELERPVIAGSSMGAATAMALALRSPERVRALVQITPAYAGRPRTDGVEDDRIWLRLADALEDSVERFVEEAIPHDMPERWRELAQEATRQRLERHSDLAAVADAMRVVPFSCAFDGIEQLERLELPVLVVGSRDEADAIHPLAVAQGYARRLPNARLVVEGEDESPIAWQGARLSRLIEDFLAQL